MWFVIQDAHWAADRDAAIFTQPSLLQNHVHFKGALVHHLYIYSGALPKLLWQQSMLNTHEPGRRMAFAIFRGLTCPSSLLRLVCTAPVKCEHLANTKQHSPKALWVSAGWNLLSGIWLIFHATVKTACCATAVRQLFVWQYFKQLFQSCWREMRVLSWEMDRRISFCLLSKAVLWCVHPNYKPSGAKLVISTFYRLSGWARIFSPAQ